MMRKQIVVMVTVYFFTGITAFGQSRSAQELQKVRASDERNIDGEVYRLKPKVDIPVTVAATAFTLFGFTQVYSKDNTPEATIRNLNVQNIPRFDRWGADVYSEKAADVSDYLFYGSMPLPFLLLADKEIRRDASKIGLLYLQAMSATGTLYTGSTMVFERYRPYAYNPAASMGDRTEGNARNSFFGGHTALVSTAAFFTAKVFSDYHPGSKLKWVFFGAAAVASGTTSYLRHRGGRHFLSDILVGTAVGTSSGILIPHFHKNPLFKNRNHTLVPYSSGRSHGLLFTAKL